MAYRFRFQALHQYREYLLKRERIALAQTLQRLETCERERTQARERLRAESNRFEQHQCEGMSVPEFLAFGEHIQTLEQRLLELESKALHLRRELESARVRVMERERDLRALSVLEEREWEAYRERLKRRQQKQTDEFAVVARNRGGEDADRSS